MNGLSKKPGPKDQALGYPCKGMLSYGYISLEYLKLRDALLSADQFLFSIDRA